MSARETDEDPPPVIQQAAAWRVALTDQGLDTSPDFEVWRRADPRHAEAWRQVSGLWSTLAAAAPMPAMTRLRRAARLRGRHGARPGWPAAAFAAALGALAIGVASSLAALEWYRPDQTISTPRNVRQVVRLDDGSRLTLDGGTQLTVRLRPNGREIVLRRGQARFDVAHDRRRPFRVRAGQETVTALGTSFTVDRGEGRVVVTLLKGQVAVTREAMPWPGAVSAQHAPPTILRPGQRISVATAQERTRATVEQVSVSRATAWEGGRLVFDNEPLSAVAARVSRYSPHRVEIADPTFANVPMSGAFDAGDSTAFVEAVVQYFPLQAVPGPRGEIVLRRRPENYP